jgi:hypothetical protein
MGIGLAVVAAAWAGVLAAVASELLKRPLPARRRMLLYGTLLTSTTTAASVFVETVGWPHGQQRIAHIVLAAPAAAGLAMVIRGAVIRDRRNHSRHRSPGA